MGERLLEAIGICPACGGEGAVGTRCPGRACSRRGYHFVPTEHAVRIQGAAEDCDPRLGRVIGKYLLVDLLGRGGFGRVYLALQMPVGMRVAVKLMDRPAAGDGASRARVRKFGVEAAALAALSHPNVVRLLEYGVDSGLPFIVMEYLEGRTLKAMLGDGGLDQAYVPPVLRQVLNALEAAHARDIVHRDIKPANVMVSRVEGDPCHVKVLDFGLAKFVEEGGDTSMLMGTPMYMAPEQVAMRDIGPWTDLYALGVIAFELLTGRRPFETASTAELLATKLDPAYDPMVRVADVDVPPAVARFLRWTMAVDAVARPRSAAEFRQAMEEVLAAPPDAAWRPARVGGSPAAQAGPTATVGEAFATGAVERDGPARPGRAMLMVTGLSLAVAACVAVAALALWPAAPPSGPPATPAAAGAWASPVCVLVGAEDAGRAGDDDRADRVAGLLVAQGFTADCRGTYARTPRNAYAASSGMIQRAAGVDAGEVQALRDLLAVPYPDVAVRQAAESQLRAPIEILLPDDPTRPRAGSAVRPASVCVLGPADSLVMYGPWRDATPALRGRLEADGFEVDCELPYVRGAARFRGAAARGLVQHDGRDPEALRRVLASVRSLYPHAEAVVVDKARLFRQFDVLVPDRSGQGGR